MVHKKRPLGVFFYALEFCLAKLHVTMVIRGVEPERSGKIQCASIAKEKAGTGRTGERVGGLEGANRMFATGRRLP